MTLAGGVADKFGNRYEGRWTVAMVGRVLADDAISITLEPPDGEGIEFTLIRNDGVAEHHQVKRSSPSGSWTTRSLDEDGLLAAMVRWTDDGHEFHLVSPAPVQKALTALVDRAVLAEDFDAFDAGLSQDSRTAFEGLCRASPGVPAERMWIALTRTVFRQMDERTTTEHAEVLLRLSVSDDPSVARAVVGDMLLDHLRRNLTGTELWRILADSLVPRSFARDPNVRATVARMHERFISDLAGMSIAGHAVTRTATDEIVALLRGLPGPVLLSAAAGMGKSVVMRAVAQALAAEMLVLPLSLADAASARDAQSVGAAVGLPASPAIVLAQLAVGGPAVLLIDQLDVVSEVSGRSPELWRAVDEILREVATLPSVRVLLACRTYDLASDPRLRKYRDGEHARTVTLGPLEDGEVDSVLSAMGVAAEDLSRAQRDILRVPLHLRLLAESGAPRGFITELDLFEAYWATKRRAVQARGGSPATAEDVVALLASQMSGRQELSVPSAMVDKWPETALLLSEHVLTGERMLAFFHETFFDFVFARSFVAGGQDLLGFLLTTDQGLFRRSQVRQVLAHQRLADPAAYARDLRSLLTDDRVRAHIKAMVLDLTAARQDAVDGEWDAVEAVINGGDTLLAGRALGVLARSPAQFDQADAAGFVERWIADPRHRDQIVWVLASMQRHRAGRVAEILARVDCTDRDWQPRLAYLATRADLTADERFLEYFLSLVATGCLDEVTTPLAANGSFWDLAHGLVKKRPEWAARFIGTYVRRRLALPAPDRQSIFNLPPDPFDAVPEPLDRDLFETVGRGAPGPYLAEVLPIVLDVISDRGHLAEDGRLDDSVWSRFRFFGPAHHVTQGLLAGLEEALSSTARSDEDAFRAVQKSLVEANSVTADDLLARAFTAVPERFASEALAWIEDNPSRIDIGYTDSSYWRGRELVAALWPHLDHGERARLETLLLAFFPRWERSQEGRRAHGHAQFVILDGLPSSELSASTRKRLDELRRKFREARPPRGFVGGFVPSPIPARAIDHMTDAQWVGAMRSYTTEEPMRAGSDVLSGGIWQVSRQLKDEAKRDPGRFMRLAAHLPPDVPAQYVEAILEGAAESDEVRREDLMDLVRLAHPLPGRPCGRTICDAVARRADPSNLPPDLVAIVTWYAVDGPEAEHPFDPPVRERGGRMGLLDVGLNTDRGRAASAIARLINDGSSLNVWKDAITHLVSDRSDAVRASTAETLFAALRHDREWVAGIMPLLFEGRPDVASSFFGERLLKHLTPTHPQLALQYISELIASPQSAVACVGGRLAALAALADVDAPALEAIATHPSEGARLGLAEVCAANIGEAALTRRCGTALLLLLDDPDPEVRREVGTAFIMLEGRDLRENGELITSFVAGAAFAESPDELLRALVVSPVILPNESVLACHRALDLAGAEAGSLASGWSSRMPDVAALAIRVYVHGPNETRSAALDVIDRLAVLDAYGYERALQDLER